MTKVLLKEISISCLGKMLDQKKNKGIPQYYLGNKNVRWGSFDLDNLQKMPFEEHETERYSITKGDLVICEGGEPGRCAIWENDDIIMFQKAIHRVRFIPEVNNYYMYYWFYYAGKRGLIDKYCTGSTIKHLPGDKLKSIALDLPDKTAQDQIANLLCCLDNKIKLNNRINQNLLKQAESIFDKYYNASFESKPFTSIIKVLGGGTPKTDNADYWGGNIPFFTPKNVGTPYTFQTEKYISDSGLEHCNSRLYPKNTSFVTARGTVGKISLAGLPMAMNQSCYALASEDIDPILVYFYALKAVSSLKHKASGAVFDAIVTRDFDTELINVLSEENAQLVLSVVSPMMETIHKNSEENIKLSSLRDTLLPKLMSGELDVSKIVL